MYIKYIFSIINLNINTSSAEEVPQTQQPREVTRYRWRKGKEAEARWKQFEHIPKNPL